MKTKNAILVLAFVTVSAASFIVLRRSANYREVQQRQQYLREREVWQGKYLNDIFSSIQPSQEGVTFHIIPGALGIMVPSRPYDDWMRGYRSFSQGETFEIKRPHYYVMYTIIRIDNDGVVVAYSPGAKPPPEGTVKLTWR